MNILDKIDQIIEEKDCPKGEHWWPVRKKCVPVGSGNGKGPRSKVEEGIPSSQEKASIEYTKKYSNVEKYLKLIQTELKKHKKDFMKKENITNWGYVGDIGHWEELLFDIYTSLKGK